MCLRAPVEIIETCGAVPLRLTPNYDNDNILTSEIRCDACAFCRRIPDMLESEYFGNIKAIYAGACCDQMRRVMDTLARSSRIPVIFFGAPRTWGNHNGYFYNEFQRAAYELAGCLETSIDTNKLERRIAARRELNSKANMLLQAVFIPASLLQRIAASPLPAEKTLDFLNRIESDLAPAEGLRLMLAGSIPNRLCVQIIETSGGNIIADAGCLGDRVFRETDGNIQESFRYLYDHYIEQNLCPHRRPVKPLIEWMTELAAERRVEGVIYRSVKYCHPWGLAAQQIKTELDLPTLIIDDDLSDAAISTYRVRIEAFMEMLQARRNRNKNR
ncbi:MAG: 2-hydroxyacyl-CoA dehydratase [Calditrichaeota bacterium]|nr:2-hydroxyacyl-CoA dehydratase [Calditrichota bacterium]